MNASFERKPSAAKRIKQSPDVIYFTSAVGMLDHPVYPKLQKLIERWHKGAALRSAKIMWCSAEHWRATYRDMLADVTHVYILPYDGGIIGAGIFEEICYLKERPCGAPEFRFFGVGHFSCDLAGVHILEDRTIRRFAKLYSDREFMCVHRPREPQRRRGNTLRERTLCT